jgi:signal recognition particle receptor subunit beta
MDEAEESRVRDILDLDPDVPVVPCDATDRESVKSVLLALLYAVVESLDSAAAAQA